MNRYLILLVLTLCFSLNVEGQTVSYEAESGTLLNGANKQNCGACSGAFQVGNMGGTTNGACIFNVNNKAGDYVLALSYSAADQRSFYVTVNDEAAVEVVCPPSGGWQTPATKSIEVELNAGENIIRFDNYVGWAPNLDRFTITPTQSVKVSGIVSSENKPLKGVLLELTGKRVQSVVTDENGYYEFKDLPINHDYVITPQSSGKVFTPVNRSMKSLSANQSNTDFVALNEIADAKKSYDFGKHGKLVYDTQTGTTGVFVNGVEIIKNAYAAASNDGKLLSSMDYALRSVSFNDITDGFGTGKKIVVWLTGNNLPQMQQVFYVYSDKDYFISEVSLTGDAISTNYMAPLISNNVSIANMGEDPNVIMMPFDNDTFIRYSSQSLKSQRTVTSSEATAFYDNTTRTGLVLGSIEHKDWKSGVRIEGVGTSLTGLEVWGGYTDYNVTRDHNAHGSISGKSVKSPKVFVGLFDDWRLGLDEYGKANAIAEPRYVFNWDKPTPVGWNSWGVIQDKITLAKAKSVVNFFKNDLPGFRVNDVAYIDLDSYWDNMVQGGLEGDFSNLKTFADYCKANGLKPGIYWGPFVDWGKYDRKVEGSSYQYAETWMKMQGAYHDFDGGRAMDPTHPATKERIKYVIGKFKSCGFEMIKIDFLGHASIEADHFYDASVTTGMQAYRSGMEYLINELGSQMLVYAAISPNLATARYAHMRRIACDAFSDINASEYTLNSTTYGWWQTNLYNYIDADHVVFNQQSLGENRARFASALINGSVITGDDFSTTGIWTNRAKDLLQRSAVLDAIKDGKAFRPVEAGTSTASEIFEKEIDGNYYVIVLNYGSQKTVDLKLNRLWIGNDNYSVDDLFTGNHYAIQESSVKMTLGAKDAVLLKFTQQVVSAIDLNQLLDTVLFYPNPTSKQLKITSREQIDFVKLLSVNGSVLTEVKEVRQNSYLLDMSKQANGIYIVCVKDAKGRVKNYRIVKE